MSTYDRNCKCGVRCADICLNKCRGIFENKGHDFGRDCYLTCSRGCFQQCTKGSYEDPHRAMECTSDECKEAKENSKKPPQDTKKHAQGLQLPNAQFSGIGKDFVASDIIHQHTKSLGVLEQQAVEELQSIVRKTSTVDQQDPSLGLNVHLQQAAGTSTNQASPISVESVATPVTHSTHSINESHQSKTLAPQLSPISQPSKQSVSAPKDLWKSILGDRVSDD